MEEATFDPDLINAIFKLIWNRRALEREKNGGTENVDPESGVGTSKKIRPTSGKVSRLSKRLTAEHLFELVGVTARLHSASLHAEKIVSEHRATNSNALKLSCELLRAFVTEAIQRAATIAEIEGVDKVEATHLERILPQLLLDF